MIMEIPLQFLPTFQDDIQSILVSNIGEFSRLYLLFSEFIRYWLWMEA